MVIEGDSKMIINLLQKIINRVHHCKLSPSWRLNLGLSTTHSRLQDHMAIIPSHVRREENKIVNKLMNQGTEGDAHLTVYTND